MGTLALSAWFVARTTLTRSLQNILCLLLALMSEITLIVLLSLYDERVFVAKIGIVIGIPVAQVCIPT